MGGIIEIDTLAGPRFAAALELMQEGGGFRFERVIFRVTPAGLLRCIVESSWSPSLVTRKTADNDLAYAEAVLRKVQGGSAEFAESTVGKSCRFELIFDDGGASFLLATREGDQLTMGPRYREHTG